MTMRVLIAVFLLKIADYPFTVSMIFMGLIVICGGIDGWIEGKKCHG